MFNFNDDWYDVFNHVFLEYLKRQSHQVLIYAHTVLFGIQYQLAQDLLYMNICKGKFAEYLVTGKQVFSSDATGRFFCHW